ncbi:MAG: SDR family oxidoreductase [Rhodospirillales bacterium]|nr:SDR family oxidoreductase [Rhodospirillales bacterium]
MNPPFSPFSLAGHRALITGGGSGLGLGIARCFAAAGAELVLAGRDGAKLAAACAELGDGARAAVFDVTDTAGADAFAASLSGISILVNNAGGTVKKPIAAMRTEEFAGVLQTHVTGAFALTRALLPQLIASRRGSVLFTASMSSFLGIPYVAGYAAAKAAHIGLVRSLATELAADGVRVNGVAPGWIDTALFRKATADDPARRARIMGRIPMGRVGTEADIGWAMTYLASDAAAYVTGHVLVVDGGALHGF